MSAQVKPPEDDWKSGITMIATSINVLADFGYTPEQLEHLLLRFANQVNLVLKENRRLVDNLAE